MKIIIKIISTLLITVFSTIFAISAYPGVIEYTQPNGAKFYGYNKGDERQGWQEHDGWSIVKLEDKWWYYAESIDGNRLTPSIIKVSSSLSQDVERELEKIPKHLKPNPVDYDTPNLSPILNQARSDTFYVPMLLVNFPDYPNLYNKNQIDSLLNQKGYTHPGTENSGSFQDFYQEQSYNTFLPISIVSIWVTAPYNHDYYGDNNQNGDTVVRDLIRSAVDQIENQGFDWSIFDNDNNGTVDALNVIHAGPGAEAGDPTNIWSHKWSLSNQSVNYDGVNINLYTINPEISGNGIVQIGVICHEFGHALGLPDLYDTDNSSTGAGSLSVMAGGSYGTSGNSSYSPSSFNAWSKYQLGWSNTVTIINSQTDIEIEQSYSSNMIYKILHPSISSEYWLIENRQKIGTDSLMYSPGLAIWHINDQIINTSGNGVNANEPYYGVALEQADGLFSLENSGYSNGGDVYPGTTNNRELSHGSIPNTLSTFGEPSLNRIDNISNPGEIMYFDVQFSDLISADISLMDGSSIANQEGSLEVQIDNSMPIGDLSFTLSYNPLELEISNIIPTNRTSFDSISINGRTIKFYNLLIQPGSGAAFNISLMNYTGAPTDVVISVTRVSAFTTSGSEIAMMSTRASNYIIEGSTQKFSVLNGSGSLYGGASFGVSAINTIPLQFMMFEFIISPSVLSLSDEPFTDLNNNNKWDTDEEYMDWNQNNRWSPAIEVTDRGQGWDFTSSVNSDGTILISGSNWINHLIPDSGRIFNVNLAVDSSANLNQGVMISSEIVQLMDTWGQVDLNSEIGVGFIVINQTLGTFSNDLVPTSLNINSIYPNPFNPYTTIELSVPLNNKNIKTSIINILGQNIKTLSDQKYNQGLHKIIWDASEIHSGIYFVKVEAESYLEIRKITLLK